MAMFRSASSLRRSFSTTSRLLKSSSAPFKVDEAGGGVKVVCRDHQSPTSLLSFVIEKSGSRFDNTVGASHALERFAFQDTEKRSGLRLVRETEQLGGRLSSIHTRESIILSAKFFRQDLPYFVDALTSVIKSPLLQEHEFNEKISKLLGLDYTYANKNAKFIALEAAHEVAFRKGLGNSLLAIPEIPISLTHLHDFAASVYIKPNLTVAAQDVDIVALKELIDENLTDLQSPELIPKPQPTSIYGGEARVPSAHGDAIVIAFPTTPDKVSHYAASSLAHAIGGPGSIKWTNGQSQLSNATNGNAIATYLPYSDAGLLCISITGPQVAQDAKTASNIIKSLFSGELSKQHVERGINQAKFDNYSVDGVASLQAAAHGVVNPKLLPDISVDSVKSVANHLSKLKPVVAAVGNVHKLPYSDELGF